MTRTYRDTCRMCAATQIVMPGNRKVPRMYRAGDGTTQCVDPIECLARRRDLIVKMQAALDTVWEALDRLALRAEWSQ